MRRDTMKATKRYTKYREYDALAVVIVRFIQTQRWNIFQSISKLFFVRSKWLIED